jgi:hypothetical protein
LRAVTICSNELGEKTLGPIAPGFVKLRFTGRRIIMHLGMSNSIFPLLVGTVETCTHTAKRIADDALLSER